MNAIMRILEQTLWEFLYEQNDSQAKKRIYRENEYGWQVAIPIYSNNGDYGYHIISYVNVDTLGALARNRTSYLREMTDKLLPKLPIPGYLVEGHTRIFVVDKINGKFLKAKFNRWKNEAFLFFRAKGYYAKGLGDMPIKLRIAWILASFFDTRASRMRETIAEKGRELYGVWVDITNMLEAMAKKLKAWVLKFANPDNWNSRKRWIAKQEEEEKRAREEVEEERKYSRKEELKRVIAESLGKIAWATASKKTIDEIGEIAKEEGVDWFGQLMKTDREARQHQEAALCYG